MQTSVSDWAKKSKFEVDDKKFTEEEIEDLEQYHLYQVI